MTAQTDEENFKVIEDDGTPLPSLGKVKMSPGAKKLRARLNGAEIEAIRKAKSLDAETILDRLNRRDAQDRLRMVAPSDYALVMIFAHLHVAGASTIEMGRVSATIRENWPQLSAQDVSTANKLADAELSAAKRSKLRKVEAPNVTDLHGFDVLCQYGRDELERANKHSPNVFTHASELVRIRDSRVEILNQKTFNHVLNTQAPFRRTQGDDAYICTAAPRDVAEHLFADTDLPVPALEKIVTIPTFSRDGALKQTPGYDKESGLLYIPADGLTIPSIPRGDLTAEAEQASAYLVDLFADFPFDGCSRAEIEASCPPSLANFLGLILTPFVAPIFDDVAPAHLLTKPAPGTGASLLAEACMIIADGRAELRPPLSRNEEERRKALFSALQTQKNYLVYDNVAGEMDSATFASFLTSREWTDRVLGRSGERTVRNGSATVLTGINPGFSPELLRRLSLIKLDAKMPNPGERVGFKIRGDFKSHIRAHRGQIIAACLTLIKHWINRGMPEASGRHLASFERWHATVGGILEANRFSFQANRNELAAVTLVDDDPMQILIEEWFERASKRGGMGMEADSGELRELAMNAQIALNVKLSRSSEDFDYDSRSFGRHLALMRDRTFSVQGVNVSLVQGERRNGRTPWRLVKRVGAQSSAPSTVAPSTVAPSRAQSSAQSTSTNAPTPDPKVITMPRRKRSSAQSSSQSSAQSTSALAQTCSEGVANPWGK